MKFYKENSSNTIFWEMWLSKRRKKWIWNRGKRYGQILIGVTVVLLVDGCREIDKVSYEKLVVNNRWPVVRSQQKPIRMTQTNLVRPQLYPWTLYKAKNDFCQLTEYVHTYLNFKLFNYSYEICWIHLF